MHCASATRCVCLMRGGGDAATVTTSSWVSWYSGHPSRMSLSFARAPRPPSVPRSAQQATDMAQLQAVTGGSGPLATFFPSSGRLIAEPSSNGRICSHSTCATARQLAKPLLRTASASQHLPASSIQDQSRKLSRAVIEVKAMAATAM